MKQELMMVGLLTFLIILACQDCDATRILMQNVSSEYKLRQELLTSYDRLVRPVLSPSAVVNVSFSVKLINIVDVDSKNEIITLKVLIEQMWENPYLKWDQSLFDRINRVRMSSKEVWVPDIKLQNSASNPSQDTQHLHENWVTVHSNGTNVWVSIAMIKSTCNFDISQFPFDEQKCDISFASESYDMEALDIHLKQGVEHTLRNAGPGETCLKSTSNGEWETGMYTVIRHVSPISTCWSTPFVHVVLGLKITRIPTFYVLYLLCPFVVLSLLVFISFTIPPDNGERIGFCSSLLLSLSVYLLLFSDLMPNNSRNLNTFGVAFVLVFLESAAVLVATVFVLKAYHATGEIPAVFKFLRFSCFHCGSKKQRYPLDQANKNQINNPSCSMHEEEPSISIKSDTAADDIPLANMTQGARMEHPRIPDEEPGDELTWLQVARRLDRLFFWFFLFVFVLTLGLVGILNNALGKVEISS